MSYHPSLVPQSAKVRIELSMAAGALDTSRSSSTAAIERFRDTQLCEDLKKLVNLDNLLDCAIMATKDKREIKVGGIFCKSLFLLFMYIDFRPRVYFFVVLQSFFACSRLT